MSLPRVPRPLVAAAFIVASLVLLAGGCLLAATVHRTWGLLAGLASFVGYVLVFARGLKHLNVDWTLWRGPYPDEVLKKKGRRDR